MRTSRRLLGLAITTAALGLPTAAHAGWSAPKPLSPADRPGAAAEIDLGFDADGDAVAAWTQAPSAGHAGDVELWVSTRPAGGAWSAPELLAADSPLYDSDDAFAPSVVVDPGGRAVVQWTENTAANTSRTVVGVAVGEAGGEFGEPFFPHATNVNQDAAEPVFAADGTLHLVYQAGLSANNAIYERTLAPGAQEWSLAATVAPAANVPQYELDLAVDAAGNRALVWTADWVGEQDVRASVRPVGGDWSAPVDLETDTGGITRPRVTIDQQGRVLAAWGEARVSAFALGSGDPTWSVAATVASGETIVDLQADADGVNHLLTHAGTAIRHRALAPDATTFGDPTAVDGSEDHDYEPALFVGPHGEAVVSWHGLDGRTRVALRDHQGWLPAAPITPEGLNAHHRASVAWDNLGNVVAGVARQRVEDGPEGADVIVLDRTEPQLLEASFQSTGVAGHPLSFAASAMEDWSDIAYEWTFGDGGKAAGASVEHTWAAAGTSTATLRVSSDGGAFDLEPVEVVISAPEPSVHHEEEKPHVEQPQPAQPAAPAAPQPVVQPPALPSIAEFVKVIGRFPKAPVVTPAQATFEQSFPSAGLAKWDLFLGRPAVARVAAAKKAKPVLLGSSSKTIAAAGKVRAKIKVSPKRRAALKRAKRPAVYLRTTFTDTAGRTVVAVKKVRYKRG